MVPFPSLRPFSSRRAYPEAKLLVASPDARPSFTRDDHGVQIEFLTRDRLVGQVRSGMAA